MKAELAKAVSTSWGEDPHLSLAVARNAGSNQLAEQAEKLVLRHYRLRIRQEFENNQDVKSLLARSKPAVKAAAELEKVLGYLRRDESSDIFHQVVDELLVELDEQRKRPGSMYLVDTDTGKALMPIDAKHIYQPPDFVGDDGKLHKARPVVHPGVAAPLILSRNDKERTAMAIAKAGPESAAAFEHFNPDSIRARAMEALAAEGIRVENIEDESRSVEIEFGKENLDGVMQSGNLRFHRAHAFAQILVRRVIMELRGSRSCSIGTVEARTTSKKRWYAVTVSFPA